MSRYARIRSDGSLAGFENYDLPPTDVKQYNHGPAIRPVEVVGKVVGLDERLFYHPPPTHEVLLDKVVERYETLKHEGFRQRCQAVLDAKASSALNGLVPSGEGAVAAWLLRESEARRWLDKGSKGVAKTEWEYPHLASLVGILGEDLDAAAAAVLDECRRSSRVLAHVERQRRITRQAIADARSDDEAYRILENVRFTEPAL